MGQATLFDTTSYELKDPLAEHIRWLLTWKEQWQRRPEDRSDLLAQQMIVSAEYAAQLATERLSHPHYEPTANWRTEQAKRINTIFHARHPHTRGRAAFAQKLYDKVHHTSQKRHIEDILQSQPVVGGIWECKRANGIYRAKVVLATESDQELPYTIVSIIAKNAEDVLPQAEHTYLHRFDATLHEFSGTPYRILHRGNL